MSMRSICAVLGTVAVMATPLAGANAAIISADFELHLSLPDTGGLPRTRILLNLGEPVAGSPDLDGSHQIENPSGLSGLATIDLDAAGLVSLTGDHELRTYADYQLAEFTISNIVFDAGESIVGFSTILDNLVDLDPTSNTVGTFTVTTGFTANSVFITYAADNLSSIFEFGDGLTSTFQIETADLQAVPLPATLPLMLTGLAVLSLVARRRKTDA